MFEKYNTKQLSNKSQENLRKLAKKEDKELYKEAVEFMSCGGDY